MRIIGILVGLLGVALLVAGVLIGLPFTGIYLMGFIGTSGREAGGQLAFLALVTLAALGIGILLIRTGQSLARRAVGRQ